ncbi:MULTISPECIES: hypothetical protein [unclassified Streptomyces]|uniref:hypothetical protein n=1 Tax=unclassified Streptomyces TaxID=2593676 RepID=UPI003819BD8D
MNSSGGQHPPGVDHTPDPVAAADAGLSMTVLETVRVRVLAACPEVYTLAGVIPPRPAGTAGRQAVFPIYVWVLFFGMLGIFGSARKTAAAMADTAYWQLILDGVISRLGLAEALRLPAHGTSWNMWNWHSKRLHAYLPSLQEEFRRMAACQAGKPDTPTPGRPLAGRPRTGPVRRRGRHRARLPCLRAEQQDKVQKKHAREKKEPGPTEGDEASAATGGESLELAEDRAQAKPRRKTRARAGISRAGRKKTADTGSSARNSSSPPSATTARSRGSF